MTAVDRRRLAARLAATLRDRWPRATIVVGGSVARGAGDRWSDVDLYLTTVEPVALAARYDWLRTVADPGSAIFHDQPTPFS